MYPQIHPALGVILKKLPKVPFTGCQYKTTLTTTVDETLSTWNNVDIGIEHPNRIVIICAFMGVAVNTTTVVHGVNQATRSRVSEIQITTHPVPTGKLVTVTVSASGSLRKAVAVYVAYPANPMRDVNSDTQNTTVDAATNNMKSVKDGFLIYIGCQLATLSTFSTTWSGTNAVTEDVDAQLESASSYTAGHINFTEPSNDLFDLTMHASNSGTKRLLTITMGVPYGY